MKHSETRKIRILRPKSCKENILDMNFPLKIHVGDEVFDKYCDKARSVLDVLVKPDGWKKGSATWLREVEMDEKQVETFIAALIYQFHELGYPFTTK